MNVYPPVAAGGASLYPPNLTNADASLAADVAMGTSAWFDGPSVSLAAGTWLIIAQADIAGGTAAETLTLRIWNGTTVYGEVDVPSSGGAGTASSAICIAVVTLGATTTVKLSAASGSGGTTLKANPIAGSGATAHGTRITAIRLA